MKVVILAGGLGTRISEYTKTIPKPMIKVCGKPIIHRIIDHYVRYGHNEFYIAPVYNELIQDGKTLVPFYVHSMHGLGTPEDLEKYLGRFRSR